VPKYDFECSAHGVIEVEHAIEVPHPKFCPVEGCKEELTRVFSTMTTVIFDGPGWTGARGNGPARVQTVPTSPESNTPYH
jgi:predicted nucleic acid-binding Zn ribbon protein